MIRLVLIDDHALIREGLTSLLSAQDDFEVVGQAERGEDATRLAQELRPDIIIMDVSMPGLGGAAATKRLREQQPQVKVLVLSGHEDAVYVRRLLTAGAVGYALKRTATQELVSAVRIVAQGGIYLDPFIAGKITRSAPSTGKPGKRATEIPSERESTVLRLTAHGLTNKEIANRLDISVKSVETYKVRISRKLDLSSRADFVRYALVQGWLQEELASTAREVSAPVE